MSDRRGLAVAAMVALVLAACGSSSDDTTTTTSPAAAADTTTTTSTTSPPSSTSSSTTSTTSPFGPATLLASVIQEELRSLGYFEGETDGILGPMTTEAITAFQTDAGITADGEYGPETYAALADALEADLDVVEALQKDLTELELYSGPADGEYGPGTVTAVEALQEECGMDVDGRFDPYTHVCLEEQLGRA